MLKELPQVEVCGSECVRHGTESASLLALSDQFVQPQCQGNYRQERN
jgi:hypothetical protein